MRNPARKAGYGTVLVLGGAAGFALAVSRSASWGEVSNTLLAGGGIVAVTAGLAFLALVGLAARGRRRLLAGKGVIARWRLTPQEWDRFRALDAARAAQHTALRNDLHIRRHTPDDGVEVIVGRREAIVDGSHHRLSRHGAPRLFAVSWLNAPADPECIEFGLFYPKPSFFDNRWTLRIPVPAAAREDGIRVFEHYRSVMPDRAPVAVRRPALVPGSALALALAGAAAGGAGWLMEGAEPGSDLAIVLIVCGALVAFGALVFALLVLLLRARRRGSG